VADLILIAPDQVEKPFFTHIEQRGSDKKEKTNPGYGDITSIQRAILEIAGAYTRSWLPGFSGRPTPNSRLVKPVDQTVKLKHFRI
jgi:hypothetical protein